MRLFEIYASGSSREWVNLDLITLVSFYGAEGSRGPELELRLAGGGAPAPITDANVIAELSQALGIPLPLARMSS
jgi:hypothetical protein